MHEVFDVCRYVPIDMTFQQWQNTRSVIVHNSLIFDYVSALTATASVSMSSLLVWINWNTLHSHHGIQAVCDTMSDSLHFTQ